MGVLFACGACGSPAVEPPRAFADSAGVHCRRCGHQLGTWGAFKERTKELILTELAARTKARGGAFIRPLARPEQRSGARCVMRIPRRTRPRGTGEPALTTSGSGDADQIPGGGFEHPIRVGPRVGKRIGRDRTTGSLHAQV